MMPRPEKEDGSILVLSLILIMTIAGLSASFLLLNLAHSKASSEDFEQELARTAAESGLAYYYSEVLLDPDYLETATVDVPSSVFVDSGGTSNPLLTVLGENSDFKLFSGSIWGQNPGDTTTAGYSQLISLGGNASSDDIIVDSGSTYYGRIYAAAHEVAVTSGSTFYGSVLSRTVVVDGSTVAIDESTLGDGLADPSGLSVLVKWRDD